MKIGETIIIGDVTIKAKVSSNVDNVTFYVDYIQKYIDNTPPYSWYWDEFEFGRHTVTAAVDRNTRDEISLIIFNIWYILLIDYLQYH